MTIRPTLALALAALIAGPLAAQLTGCAGKAHTHAEGTEPDDSAETATAVAPASTEPTTAAPAYRVQPGTYAATFDAARDVLRDEGFILDRVDAQLGVITTMPKGTGGIATPWDKEQSSIGEEIEDAVHRHQRVVRLEFAPEGTQPGSIDIADLRTEQRPIDLYASVAVYRVNQPGWRLNPYSVLNSTYARDTQLDERGLGMYLVATRQDQALAEKIASKVAAKAARASGE